MNDPNIQVQELEPMETIVCTGTFRIVSFELVTVEEIVLPSELESDDADG